MAEFQYANDVGTPSYEQIIAFERRSGVPFTVTSTTNHSRMTVSGNVSLHFRGNAVDTVSSAGNMQALAAWLIRYAPYIMELIHSGGPGYFVKNGKVVAASYYGATIVSQHYNHVHCAMTLSGLAAAGGAGGGVGTSRGQTPEAPVRVPSASGIGCLPQAATVAAALAGIGEMAWHLIR